MKNWNDLTCQLLSKNQGVRGEEQTIILDIFTNQQTIKTTGGKNQ